MVPPNTMCQCHLPLLTSLLLLTSMFQFHHWNVPPVSESSWALAGDVETRFDISSKESPCKLAVECRVAQLAIDKDIKFSQDGTLYSEFLAQVRSQPNVLTQELPMASGAIREGADTDSSGTSQTGVPFLAFPSSSSQSSKPCSQRDLPSWQSDPSSLMQWG